MFNSVLEREDLMDKPIGCPYCQQETPEPMMELIEWPAFDMMDHGLEIESNEAEDGLSPRLIKIGIIDGRLTLSHFDNIYSVKIKYCPVCGWKLGSS